MPNVNALPRGLVSYLDLVTQGSSPDTLVREIQGIVDLGPLFNLGKRQRSSSQAPAGTVGDWGIPTLTVPPNEAWLLLAYTVGGNVPIGINAAIAPCVQMPFSAGPGTGRYQVGTPYRNTSSVSISPISAHMDVPPFLLPPGTVLGGATLELSGATAFDCYGNADFVRIRL